MHRQGDVLIVEVTLVPRTARRVSPCILALGEATGHSHRIESGAEQLVEEDGTQYVRVLAPVVEVRHEEHGPVMRAGAALYRVVHQRECARSAQRGSVDVLD